MGCFGPTEFSLKASDLTGLDFFRGMNNGINGIVYANYLVAR